MRCDGVPWKSIRLAGGLLGNGCAGGSVVVDAAGTIQLTLQPRSAIVIDAETLR